MAEKRRNLIDLSVLDPTKSQRQFRHRKQPVDNKTGKRKSEKVYFY